MSDRSARLAETIEQQSEEMLKFLGGLTEPELRASCNDPGGSTVGAVVAHLSEGYGQVLGWIERVASGPSHGADGVGDPRSGHAHRSDSGNVSEQIERLRRGGTTWAALTRDLSDGQLDRVPPVTTGIADGRNTLVEVIELMVEHQTTHVNHMKQAVLDRAEPRRQPT